MRKRFCLILGLLAFVLASCGSKTISYMPVEEASVEKLENTITQVYEEVEAGCIGILAKGINSSSSGSGVIYKEDNGIYYAVTNAHVVEGATSFMVYFGNGQYVSAKLVGYDTKNDIGVLSFSLDFSSKKLKDYVKVIDFMNYDTVDYVVPGQTILAIGCPTGLDNFNILTSGIISSVDKLELSHTAAINPGNSGGGLFNLRGRLIGLNNKKEVWTSSSVPVEGRGFAISYSVVRGSIIDIEKSGIVKRPVLGITSVEVNSLIETEAYNKYKANIPADGEFNHVVITSVVAESKASLAGLLEGDVILKVNDNTINRIRDLTSLLTFISYDSSYTFTIYRNNEIINIIINT